MTETITIAGLLKDISSKRAFHGIKPTEVQIAHAYAMDAELRPANDFKRKELFLKACQHMIKGTQLGSEACTVIADWALKAGTPEFALYMVGLASSEPVSRPICSSYPEKCQRIAQQARSRLAGQGAAANQVAPN